MAHGEGRFLPHSSMTRQGVKWRGALWIGGAGGFSLLPFDMY